MRIPSTLPVPDKREFWAIQDSTKLQCADRCMRRYFYEYVLGWTSDAPSNHLVFGKAWHEALEHLYTYKLDIKEVPNAWERFIQCYRAEFPENTDTWFKGKNPNIVPQALVEYCQINASDVYEWRVLALETGGMVPISADRMIALRMDIIAQDSQGTIFGVEHKTGSTAGRTWTMQWGTSIQIGTYLHALAASYVDHAEKARILVNGTFFYTKERKQERVWQRRSGWAMLNWLDTVNSIYDRIEAHFERLALCRDSDIVMEAFPMSPTSCTDYGGCAFYDVCTSVSNPLRYCQNDPLTGLTYRWWNPLADVKTPLEVR